MDNKIVQGTLLLAQLINDQIKIGPNLSCFKDFKFNLHLYCIQDYLTLFSVLLKRKSFWIILCNEIIKKIFLLKKMLMLMVFFFFFFFFFFV